MSLISDHFSIYFSIVSHLVNHSLPKTISVYNFWKGDMHGLCNFLLDCDFSFCLSSDIELIWAYLKYLINNAFFFFLYHHIVLNQTNLPNPMYSIISIAFILLEESIDMILVLNLNQNFNYQNSPYRSQWPLQNYLTKKSLSSILPTLTVKKFLIVSIVLPTISLQQGYLPAEWCIHQITPIPKSGDKMFVTNDRPISLLCTISKVLEHIVYDKVIEFLSVWISTSQFGFTKNSSTLQLFIFLSDIYNSYELGLQTNVIIYTDLKKAFDAVPHDELLFKLWSTSICGSLWKWFHAYLTSRFHCVSIHNSLSSLSPVLSGVPQGSILGPILLISCIY